MSAIEPVATTVTAAAANVDAREVAYYEALAHTWWDRTGPFWPLHALNALRTEYLRRVLARAFSRNAEEPRPLGGISVLDVGCGGGILSESIARLGAAVHGIDVVEKNVAVARLHARESGLPVRYDTTTAAALAQCDATYDIVLNMEVVEHVPDVPSFIGDCARLVTPGGVMVLATINRTFLAWLFAIVGAEYVLRWLPRGTHRWRQFVTPEELKGILDANELQTFEEIGVRVNPINRHFALTRAMAVNYMLVARRPENPPADHWALSHTPLPASFDSEVH